MSAIIKCLCFDDDNRERERVASWIVDGWKNEKTGVDIDVMPTGSAEDVPRLLGDEPSQFDAIVLDVFVAEGARSAKLRPLGLPLISTIRKTHPTLAIVAISVGGEGVEQKTIDLGADRYVGKDYLIETGEIGYLGKCIREALRLHGKDPAPYKENIVSFNDADIPLTALIDTVGKGCIISLVHGMLNQPCSSIRPLFVRSGLSGASVLRVDCTVNVSIEAAEGMATRNLLLKIARDGEGLRNEGGRDISMFADDLFVPPINKSPVQSGSWYAIAYNFRRECKTLLDWLLDREDPTKEIAPMLDRLFVDGERSLHETYGRELFAKNVNPATALWKVLTDSRRARIRLALDELGSLAKKHARDSAYDETVIKTFLSSGAIPGIDMASLEANARLSWSHGDFHARNILVTRSGHPYLIDRANVGPLPWPADVARLVVDLIVSGWDAGDESHTWEAMKEWIILSRAVIRGDGVSRGQRKLKNAPIRNALNWIRQNLYKIHGLNNALPADKPEWQFKVAMGVEFLRAAYRHEELPSPKRALGLVAACEAFREARPR